MREKNRKPIANNRKRLPQFTTMNVIDGQAGLVNYSSLIFYSLTIDNILNIIVLLILAAVSIATLTGENGLLTRANDAKTETEEAKEDELRRLTALEAATNLENTIYIDNSTGEEKTVTIPAGFAVSQVEGENTIEDGLVIIDSKGNEFVWVPVENFNEFKREHFGTSSQKWWSGTFVTDGLSGNNMYEPKADGEANNSEVEKMYRSIKYNGGFYVGRYEAGTNSSNARTGTSGIEDSIVIKKGVNVYNYIGWADTDDMADETGGAVQKSREFAEENGYTTVESTLIYGVQWDAIMRWMKDEPNLTGGKYVQDSTGMGWYSNNYEKGNPNHVTGIDVDSKKSNCIKNIYDLAGNVWEWTMESNGTLNRVYRGGRYDYLGSIIPASYRSSSSPSVSSSSFGFRVTLFLN